MMKMTLLVSDVDKDWNWLNDGLSYALVCLQEFLLMYFLVEVQYAIVLHFVPQYSIHSQAGK